MAYGIEGLKPGLLPEGEDLILSARGVSLVYPKVVALQPTDVDVGYGLTLIEGESSAGKTSLLSVIIGAERATTGIVNSMGVTLTTANEDELERWRRGVSVVTQNHNLTPNYSALDNIVVTHGLAGIKIQKDAAADLLVSMGIEDFTSPVDRMSPGQKQRISIVRALAKAPRAIFADEPTSSLDSAHKGDVHELLVRAAHDRNIPVLLVSHDLVARTGADRIITMQGGRIIEDNRQVA